MKKIRIGPHNLNIMSLIIGSLLSNSYLEKRGCGIRIIFTKCSNNVEYLMWFHSVLFNVGYCSKAKPKLFKLIGKYNKVLFIYSFKSYSFSSFIWLYNMFYRDNLKIIPRYLDGYFTPLALATLFLSSTRLEKRGVIFPKTLILIEDFKYLSLLNFFLFFYPYFSPFFISYEFYTTLYWIYLKLKRGKNLASESLIKKLRFFISAGFCKRIEYFLACVFFSLFF